MVAFTFTKDSACRPHLGFWPLWERDGEIGDKQMRNETANIDRNFDYFEPRMCVNHSPCALGRGLE